VFLALGLLVQFNNPDYFQYFFPFVILFSLITVFRKAPVDNPENPIVDSNEQRRLKRMSVIILLVFLLLAAIASFYYSWMAASILLGIVWQVFTLTSWGHMFYNCWDQILGSIETIFQRKEGYSDD
ncbi:MAG: accessory gene regulator B family protein, partial [Syntrophomonadaceae bacterium]|nr:accessory gene regulator B family protein [Syntrophomonadaceae bacterium]